MFIQAQYYMSYITSFTDHAGENGVVFCERQDRRSLMEVAKTYSMTNNYLVFFSSTNSAEPEKIYFQGKEMHLFTQDDEMSYITIDDNSVKVLKESSEGFYLAAQEFKL